MGHEQRHPVDENLIALTSDPTATDESAVLAAVKQREIELKTDLLKARQEADEILAKARTEAAAIKADAAAKAQRQGAAIMDKEVDAAKTQAAEVTLEAAEAAKKLTREGRKSLDQAVDFVLQSVLPKTEKEVTNVLEDGQS